MHARIRLALPITVLLVSGASAAAPQAARNGYLNFESPQVKPIATATIGDRPYLFVCNTPDNSVDVYAIDNMEGEAVSTTPANPNTGPDDVDRGYTARIPVGLEPVSLTLATIDGTMRLYTANWLGDSVTFVKLTTVAAEDDEEALRFEIERVVHVGDEPMCVAVLDNGPGARHLLVTKRTASSFSQLDPVTGAFQDVLETPGGSPRAGGGADVIMTSDGSFANVPKTTRPDEGEFVAPVSAPTGAFVLKEPHTVAALGTRFWVLGQQGGGSKLSHEEEGVPIGGFNLDLWGMDLASPSTPPVLLPAPSGNVAAPATSGTGTTNFNMAAKGNHLYVVSTDALNQHLGGAALLARPTGFVRTLLCKIDVGTGAIVRRDLNADTAGANGSVPKSQSLAHCTDVAAFRGQKVCVVAFNSDRFAIVNTANSSPGLWTIERTNITAFNDDDGTKTGLNIAGPRGVAVYLDPAEPLAGQTQDLDRIFVLNRLDHSISVIDPNNAPALRQIYGFALPVDPVPDEVRRGQQFLYSASLGSANGFVSCASCHIDGRSDQLQWRLGSEDVNLPSSIHAPLDIPVAPHEISDVAACIDDDLDTHDATGDGFPSVLAEDRAKPFDFEHTNQNPPACISDTAPSPNAKGPMITQSLQGLLNLEVVSGSSFVTNAPYHWRGDKPDFDAFNEAFVALQGLADLEDGNPATEPNRGFEPLVMADYTTFVNSIHYPPNHLQPRTRVYEGDPGSPTGLNGTQPTSRGTGAAAGLKLFHTLPTPGLAPRSCVQCHFLPEGSNNRLTFQSRANIEDQADLYLPFELKRQPIETAALRGLTQKEGRLSLEELLAPEVADVFVSPTDLRSGDLGTGHNGLEGLNRNNFLTLVLNRISTLNSVLSPDVDEETLENQIVPDIERINDFVRQIDHGVAPIVGRMLSLRVDEVDFTGATPVVPDAAKAQLLADMEAQVAAANAGLAVYVRFGPPTGPTVLRYWYDLRTATNATQTPKYSPPIGTPLTRDQLLELVENQAHGILVFSATPLGSDLRVASEFGIPAVLQNSDLPPASFAMVDTRPNSAYRNIPSLTANLPGTTNSAAGLVNFQGTAVSVEGPAVGAFLSLDVLDVLQDNVLAGIANANTHDASRRLRVTGAGLVPGAKVVLEVPTTHGAQDLELPIYPTMEFTGPGERIWETAIELEPLVVYLLRLGALDPANGDYARLQAILAGTPSEATVPPYPYAWRISNALSSDLQVNSPFVYTQANP
jgi:hypothetical protein